MYILKCKKIWNVNIVVVQIIVKMAMQVGFSVITAKTVNAWRLEKSREYTWGPVCKR